MNDRVTFEVHAPDYLHLHAAAVVQLNAFFGRDVLTTRPKVEWELSCFPTTRTDGTPVFWSAEVDARVVR